MASLINDMSLQELIETMEIILVTDENAFKKKHVVCLENVKKEEKTMRGVVAAVDIPKGSCWLERKTYSVTKYLVNQFSGSELPMDSLMKEMMEPYENKTYADFLTMFGYKDVELSLNNVVSTSISNGAPLLSMLNHDINGNVDYYWYGYDHKDGKKPEIIRFCCTNRVIQKGEELTTSYFSLHDTEDVVRNRYYKDREFAIEETAESLLSIWDSARDSIVEYMKKNPVFLQIKRDLVHTTEGKPCLLKQDIKKEGKLPKEIYSMNKKINGDCGICWDAITFRGILNTRITRKDDGDMKCGPCDHLFCFKCIKEWSKKNNTCPICRQTFTRIAIFPIMPSDFVGKFVIAEMCNSHYTLKKINHLLDIRFSQLFPCCETFVEDRLKYMKRIFTLLEPKDTRNQPRNTTNDKGNYNTNKGTNDMANFNDTIFDFDCWGTEEKERISDELVKNIGSEVQLTDQLGVGSSGIAYLTKDGRVVKIVMESYISPHLLDLRFSLYERMHFEVAEKIGEMNLGPKVFQYGKLHLPYLKGEKETLEAIDDASSCVIYDVGPEIIEEGIPFWYIIMERLYDISAATNNSEYRNKRKEVETAIKSKLPDVGDFEFGFINKGMKVDDLRAFDLLDNE